MAPDATTVTEGDTMASHHRKGYRRKDGTWVRATRVKGKNPAPGCSLWLLGSIALAAIAWIVGS